MRALFDTSSRKCVAAPFAIPFVLSQAYAIAVLLVAVGGFPLLTVAEGSNAEQDAALEAILSTPPIPASQLPTSGNFYSAQRPELPPLPANLYSLPAWDFGGGLFVLDDTTFDYGFSTHAIAVPSIPSGGSPLGSQPYTSNDLWLAINAVTNGCTGPTADLTIHTPADDTNSSYDVFHAPSLDSPTDWQFLMRCPTNVIAQTNVFARYLCEDQGYFGLMEVATNCDLIVTNVTPQEMAELLVPPWVTITNATYTGATVARGVFSNGNCCGLPIDSGLVLSSGFVSDALGPNDDNGLQLISSLGEPGDTDLGKLVGNAATLDATVLEFSIISTNSLQLSLQYVFASEEYPEWIDDFNDPMAIFASTNNVGAQWVFELTNCVSIVPCSSNTLVGIGSVNGGEAGGGVSPTNPEFYRDNDDPDNSAAAPYAMGVPVFNIQYDGMTVLLTAQISVTANVTTRLKIGVADFEGGTEDDLFDSAVFLKSWSLAPCQ